MNPAQHAENRPRRGLLATAGFVVVLGLVVGVTAAFGGLRREVEMPKATGPGHAVDEGLFRVVPLDARLTTNRQFGGPRIPVVVVRARVTNVGDRSFGVIPFLDGVTGEPTPGHQTGPDQVKTTGRIGGSETSHIDPWLPVDVLLTWPVPKNVKPRNITVVFRKWSYGQEFSSDVFEWSVTSEDPVAGRIILPVRRGRS